MKTRNTSSLLVVLIAAFLALAATRAEAFVVIGGAPIGITFGQTARVNILNISARAFIIEGGKFLDANCNTLAEFGRQSIEPGKVASLDLEAVWK